MRLSPTQADALDVIARNGGSIIRRAGGFWTFPACAETRPGVPAWSISVQTVRALEAKGKLTRAHINAEWCDPRVIKPATVCAWCPDFNPRDPANRGKSHVMCPACATKFVSEATTNVPPRNT
jgi:hypothetical protein